MSFKNKQNTDWGAISGNFDNLPYYAKRELHYPEASDADIGHIYDILSTIIDTLSTQYNIDIDLKGDQVKIDHRKAIKAKFPKD
tara:strand:- start:37194 stop:37445 length:252 start_codon:yes stop_codon:yes gene_type:complete